MGRFIYFRNGSGAPVTAKDIANYKMQYAFSGSAIENRETNEHSPSSSPGVLFASPAAGQPAINYNEESQSWLRFPPVEGRPDIYVGFDADAPPGPQDLKREVMLDGALVVLADGNQWQIPTVRRFLNEKQNFESALPARYTYNGDGKIALGDVLPKYHDLWEKTAPLATATLDQRELTQSEMFTAVEALLSANYRVTLPELFAIGALANDESLALIVLVSTRFDELMGRIEAVKKKSDHH